MRPPTAKNAKARVPKKNASDEEGGGNKHRHAGTTMVVDEEDFFHYTNFRILDSIGYPGAYRKFLLRRKEQGSEWATKMNNHVIVVQHSIRELSILEQVPPLFFICDWGLKGLELFKKNRDN